MVLVLDLILLILILLLLLVFDIYPIAYLVAKGVGAIFLLSSSCFCFCLSHSFSFSFFFFFRWVAVSCEEQQCLRALFFLFFFNLRIFYRSFWHMIFFFGVYCVRDFWVAHGGGVYF
jgi:hypothetical protein